MYRIGKIVDVFDEKEEVQFIEVEQTSFHSNEKKTTKIKALEISVSGNLNNDDYSLHFIINKSIEEFINLENYDRIRVSNNHIIDSYIKFNDVTYLNLEINVEIMRLATELNIYFVFQEENKDFFGEVEFSIDLDVIEAELL